MAFTKGHSGNAAGRKPGSLNKATAAVKERIETVLSELDTTLSGDLAALTPTERVELWAKLQEFIRPKLSRTALTSDTDGPLRGVVQIELVGNCRPPTTREQDVLD